LKDLWNARMQRQSTEKILFGKTRWKRLKRKRSTDLGGSKGESGIYRWFGQRGALLGCWGSGSKRANYHLQTGDLAWKI